MPKLFGREDDEEPRFAVTNTRTMFLFVFGYIIFCFILAFGIGWWAEGLNYLSIIIVACIIAGPSYWEKLRYNTRGNVSTPDNHYSLNVQEIYPVGPWIIFKVGGIMTAAFSPSGGQGCVIVPNNPLIVNQKARRSFYINAHPHAVKFEHLLPEIRDALKNNNIGPPYRFAIAPAEYPLEIDGNIIMNEIIEKNGEKEIKKYIPTNEAIQELLNLEDRVKRVSQQNYRKDGYLDGDFDRVLDVAEAGKRLAKVGKPGTREGLKEKILGHGKEEEG